MIVRNLLIILLGGVLAGCGTIGYYAQSVRGQMELLRRAQPIDRVLADPSVDQSIKDKLEKVKAIRRFASEHLLLPDNESYTEYADLGRPYVVWNVFAAPALSLEAKRFCFPIAGCVVYRGYFKRQDAHAFAAKLAARGLDAYVGGVPAYSTLGWFDDPMLNTVVHYPEAELAGLVFHELAHQLLYVKGDSVFNESFATTVEIEGVRRWRNETGNPSMDGYELRKRRQDRVIGLILQYRDMLAQLYASAADEAAKRRGKDETIADLKAEFASWVTDEPTYAAWQPWFDKPINNATFVAVAAYHDWVPAFSQLLAEHDGQLEAFYAAVRALASLDKVERDQRLADLAAVQAEKGVNENRDGTSATE